MDIDPSKKPDVVGDVRSLPFKNEIFEMVIFDPPHVPFGPNANMAKDFGHFNTQHIKSMIREGFPEMARVLFSKGKMIFKWSDHDISLEKILALGSKFIPLCGHKTAYHTKHASKTFWVLLEKGERPDRYQGELF